MKNTITVSMAELDQLRKIAQEAQEVTIKTPETRTLRQLLAKHWYEYPETRPPSNVIVYNFRKPDLFDHPDIRA